MREVSTLDYVVYVPGTVVLQYNADRAQHNTALQHTQHNSRRTQNQPVRCRSRDPSGVASPLLLLRRPLLALP